MIPVCAKNTESNCRCFSNNGIHDGWAQGRPSSTDNGGTKGGAIADHLAHCSPEEAKEIQGYFLDDDIIGIELEPWKTYFDGSTYLNGIGIGVILISLKGTHIPFFGRLNFPTTNNATKYKACIMGLKAALGSGNERSNNEDYDSRDSGNDRGEPLNDKEDEDAGAFYEDNFDDDVDYYDRDIEDGSKRSALSI